MALMMHCGWTGFAQAENPTKPAAQKSATSINAPAEVRSSSRQGGSNAPAVQSPGMGTDRSRSATPAATTATPATQPVRSPAHPVQAPTGAEAARSKPAPVHARHSGPTPVRKPTGAEAAHAKTTPVRARHSGPTPVNKNKTEAGTKSK